MRARIVTRARLVEARARIAAGLSAEAVARELGVRLDALCAALARPPAPPAGPRPGTWGPAGAGAAALERNAVWLAAPIWAHRSERRPR
jgi:hypothetical protein